jgi:hypothetical protein
MSSLITCASPYNQTMKRTPSIGKRKTQKVLNTSESSSDFLEEEEPQQQDLLLSPSMTSTIAMNEERGNAINDMLNKITASPVGEGLVDFKPVTTVLAKEGFESPLLKRAAGLPEYVPSDIGTDSLSNYNKSYEAGAILGKPYYNRGKVAEGNDGVMQKLNYITHILEDLQMEKTSNITEELILYSFLGVFVIFVVDSFARVGKYHR